MKKIIFFFFFIGFNSIVFSQNQNSVILNFPIFDNPYYFYGVKTVSNSSYPNFNLKTADYFKAYENPSMFQSLNYSASFYNVLNLGLSKLKINIFKNPLLNYLTESLIYSGVLLVSEYIPLGDSWLHEEFHRAVLTKNYVNSYNQVNDFPFLAELISVNNVTDENLIRLKNSNPVDFIRLHAAGIEGEYMLTKELQKKSFFYNQQYPYFTFELLWTANSFFYVWICHTDEAEVTTDEVNLEEGANLKIRDFTGLDFTAWVYDLFKPYEAYELRGIHPSGIGIDRYIKPSDLTVDELKYLKKQGFLQLLNFASPMLWGINNIPINLFNKKWEINFSVRHLLTSFGNDISFDLFLKQNKFMNNTVFHLYSNGVKSFPGLESNIIDYNFSFGAINLKSSFRTMVWLLPENLLFYDSKFDLGGLADITLALGKKSFYPYLQFGYKTKGWVAANEFQGESKYFRFGLSWYINQRKF